MDDWRQQLRTQTGLCVLKLNLYFGSGYAKDENKHVWFVSVLAEQLIIHDRYNE